MAKTFLTSLNIPFWSTGDGEDDEKEVLYLPFCPRCHTKVSVLAAYQTEKQNIESKFNSIRKDIAFTAVETIRQNSAADPIRQEIYDSKI